MCFEHECFVNHSLCIKEIWFKNIWDQKHFGSKSILIQTYFPKFFESVLNLSGMCFEHECYVNHSLGIKEIWFQKHLDQKHFGSKNILIQTNSKKIIEAVLNLSGMCFEHECLFLIIA